MATSALRNCQMGSCDEAVESKMAGAPVWLAGAYCRLLHATTCCQACYPPRHVILLEAERLANQIDCLKYIIIKQNELTGQETPNAEAYGQLEPEPVGGETLPQIHPHDLLQDAFSISDQFSDDDVNALSAHFQWCEADFRLHVEQLRSKVCCCCAVCCGPRQMH